MNNKILLGFNIVLLVAVIILFVLYAQLKSSLTPASKSESATVAGNTKAPAPDDLKFKIAYFELDSLSNNYTYYKNVRKGLSIRENQIQSQLTNLKNSIINKAQYYNEKGPNMNQNEQIAAQQEMQKLQQNYAMKEQELTQQFHDETNKKLLEVRTRIQNFLKVYAKEKGFSYVVATSEDDNIFYYKDSVRNITTDIVNGLNGAGKK